MPSYEWSCEVCGKTESVFCNIADRDKAPICVYCHLPMIRNYGGESPAFHLKGDGWYKTDYKGGYTGSNGHISKTDKENAYKKKHQK